MTRCRRCRRKLRNKAHAAAGIGPTCRKREQLALLNENLKNRILPPENRISEIRS